jgi:hypothetical protein
MQSLPELEQLCNVLYNGHDPSERAHAENSLRPFSVNVDYIPQCKVRAPTHRPAKPGGELDSPDARENNRPITKPLTNLHTPKSAPIRPYWTARRALTPSSSPRPRSRSYSPTMPACPASSRST